MCVKVLAMYLMQSFKKLLEAYNYVIFKDVNECSNIRIFVFRSNIRIRFLNSNIRIFSSPEPKAHSLIGELIGYSWSGVRPSSSSVVVRPS